MRPHTCMTAWAGPLKACELSTDLTWYQCTRHTFASQWVMANGSIEKLAAEFGHSSTEVTRRYAHLRPDHFREADRHPRREHRSDGERDYRRRIIALGALAQW